MSVVVDKVGGAYPRKGATAPDARIAESSAVNNRRGVSLNASADEPTEEKKPRKGSKK